MNLAIHQLMPWYLMYRDMFHYYYVSVLHFYGSSANVHFSGSLEWSVHMKYWQLPWLCRHVHKPRLGPAKVKNGRHILSLE